MSDLTKPTGDVPTPQPAASLADDPRVDEILDIVAKETSTSRSQLQMDAEIKDLGIESFDLVQTVFALESKFNIDIPVVPDRSGNEFTTVGDLVGHVLATLDRRPAEGKPA